MALDLYADGVRAADLLEDHAAIAAIAGKVRGQLNRGQYNAFDISRGKAGVQGQASRLTTKRFYMNRRGDEKLNSLHSYRRHHLRIVTTVPRPGTLSIVSSSMSRLAPGSPMPMPVPDVYPSR